MNFFQPFLIKKLASKSMALFDVSPFHISHSLRSLVVHYSGYSICHTWNISRFKFSADVNGERPTDSKRKAAIGRRKKWIKLCQTQTHNMSRYLFKIHMLAGAMKVVIRAFMNVSEGHEETNRVQCVIKYEYKK